MKMADQIVALKQRSFQQHLENLSRTYRSRMHRHRASATKQRTREAIQPQDVTSAHSGRRSARNVRTSHNDPHHHLTLSGLEGRRSRIPSSCSSTIHSARSDVGLNRVNSDDDPCDDVMSSESRPVVKATVRVRKTSTSVKCQQWAPSPEKIVVQSDSAYRNPPTRPYIKFRRAARAIMLIQRVCRVCKNLVYASVCSEEWYTRIENFGTNSGSGFVDQSKRVRPFITLVPNQDKQLVQLTFDRSEFFKERRVDLTDEMRGLLNMKMSARSPEQINEVVRFLKRASPAFNSYTLDTQRQMVQCMWFDTYQKERVITAQGSQADGIFFVLSGKLVEKAKDRKQLREIKQGEGFGEEELKCACPRRTTVVTQTTVDLITIHRQDYRAIFNMSIDSNDPKYLDICKQDLVFQHFPIHRLIDNPGVWTVLSYKFGCLMVKDSNEMEWIYIIKSGEARVIKHLSVADFNVRKRRREIEERQNLHSASYRSRQLIEFIESKDAQKSHYSRDVYVPARPATKSRASAPPGLTLAQQRRRRLDNTATVGGGPSLERSKTTVETKCVVQSLKQGNLTEMDRDSCIQRVEVNSSRSCGSNNKTERSRPHTGINIRKPTRGVASMPRRPCTGVVKPVVEIRIQDFDKEIKASRAWDENDENDRSSNASSPRSDGTSRGSSLIDASLETNSRGRYVATGAGNVASNGINDVCLRLPTVGGSACSRSQQSSARGDRSSLMVKVPPFVQLEALIPGKVFGLRSCLKPEERGPSASLVSGGCEVLQINKKFFLKHADEAILSLIKLKYKAFPSEEELVDRLDVNIRWEEYKQSTVLDFLRQRGKQATGYNTAFVSVA